MKQAQHFGAGLGLQANLNLKWHIGAVLCGSRAKWPGITSKKCYRFLGGCGTTFTFRKLNAPLQASTFVLV